MLILAICCHQNPFFSVCRWNWWKKTPKKREYEFTKEASSNSNNNNDGVTCMKHTVKTNCQQICLTDDIWIWIRCSAHWNCSLGNETKTSPDKGWIQVHFKSWMLHISQIKLVHNTCSQSNKRIPKKLCTTLFEWVRLLFSVCSKQKNTLLGY